MKITLKNLDSAALLKILSDPKSLFSKHTDKSDKGDKKDIKETMELNIVNCNFSSKSLPALINLLKQYPLIQMLHFDTCTFFPEGNKFPYLRTESVMMLGFLGQKLAETNIQHFVLLDPENMTSAQATMNFAKNARTNSLLQTMTYHTGTRGTEALCEAIQNMPKMTAFVNPNINSPAHIQSQTKRANVNAMYLNLQEMLKQRQEEMLKREALERSTASVMEESSAMSEPEYKPVLRFRAGDNKEADGVAAKAKSKYSVS